MGNISQLDLLALGDSYISGEGAFEYLPGTDTDNNKCHLSSLSYPLLLGASLNFNSYHSVACSGATTNDIKNTSISYAGQTINRVVRDKLSQAELDSIISNFNPGYIDQLDFVKQYQPKSIVLSVGGNDVNMIGKLKACIKPGTCYSTYEDRLEFVKDINNVFSKLVSTYQKLKQSGPPDIRIYVVAYPQIAKTGGNCALNVHLDNDEVIFTNQAISYLDDVVKAAAAKAGVFYVDTQDAFYGHRFCEAGPGSVAINGVTAGNEIPKRLGGPIGSESFHPNALGHELLHGKILRLTHSLTALMPDPNLASSLPSPDSSGILDAPKSGRTINLPEYDPGLVPDLAYAGTAIDLTSSSSDHSLSPGTVFNAELHSDPITLGHIMTDAKGNIITQLTIPADMPAGYHILHLYGADLTGQQIDIYKDIYIAKTADDLDGNGVDDSVQKCVGVEPSGQDSDNDGVDDACDANIGIPTTLPASNTADIQGTVIATGISNTTNSNKTSEAKIVNDSLSSTGPRVLGDSTSTKSSQKNSAQTDDLYIKPKYYGAGGAGFLGLSLVSYFIKRRWF
jgi:lysophospholipase L1-like esterase